MAIRRTYPMHRLRDEMDRLFSEAFSAPLARSNWLWSPVAWERGEFPALNIWEDDDNLYAEAEVPGLEMSDLELFAVGNELTIRGERRPFEQEGVSYHRRERGTGVFSRVIRLPVEIEAEKVEASLRNGVLTITLPKAASARPRKIEVRAQSE